MSLYDVPVPSVRCCFDIMFTLLNFNFILNETFFVLSVQYTIILQNIPTRELLIKIAAGIERTQNIYTWYINYEITLI